MLVYMCGHTQAIVCMWRSEDSLQESVLPRVSWRLNEGVRVWQQHLYQPCYLTGSEHSNAITMKTVITVSGFDK